MAVAQTLDRRFATDCEGMLTIEWPADDAHVAMTGPAVTVFEGEIEI